MSVWWYTHIFCFYAPNMTFWSDFGRGFKKGWNGTLKVMKKVPIVKEVADPIPMLHKGGKVGKTGNYRLRAGEVVMNKTQLTALKKAKTAKTKNKIISSVAKKKPKKMKHRRR